MRKRSIEPPTAADPPTNPPKLERQRQRQHPLAARNEERSRLEVCRRWSRSKQNSSRAEHTTERSQSCKRFHNARLRRLGFPSISLFCILNHAVDGGQDVSNSDHGWRCLLRIEQAHGKWVHGWSFGFGCCCCCSIWTVRSSIPRGE